MNKPKVTNVSGYHRRPIGEVFRLAMTTSPVYVLTVYVKVVIIYDLLCVAALKLLPCGNMEPGNLVP